MFLIRWLRTLVSLPVQWPGQLLAAFGMPAGAGLLRAAYAINGNGEIGRQALALILKHAGLEVAAAQASVWMTSRPTPHVASFAGLLALDIGDLPGAKGFAARGRQLGDDPSGLAELLDYYILRREGDQEAIAGASASMERRSDLSPTVSKLIAVELMWQEMLSGRFDEARGRAGWLLQIDDAGEAHVVLWALARRAGNQAVARAHDGRGAFGSPQQMLHCQVLACVAIGALDDAKALLQKCREAAPALVEPLGRLIAAREGAA